MKTLNIIPAVAATMLASTAMAQDVSYLSYGVEYDNLSIGDESGDIISAGATFETAVNSFLLSGNFGTVRFSDGSDDVSISSVGLRAGYYVTPNAIVFGNVNYLTAEDENLTTYTLGGEAGFGAFTVGLSYTDSNEDSIDSASAIYGSYQVGSNLEVGFAVTDQNDQTVSSIGLDFDNDRFDIVALYSEVEDVNVFGMDGEYDFGNRFRANMSYTDFDGEFSEVSLGAGYEVRDNMWVDFNVGRIDADDSTDSIDVIGLALTFETGEQALLIDRTTEVQSRSFGSFGTLVSTLGR